MGNNRKDERQENTEEWGEGAIDKKYLCIILEIVILFLVIAIEQSAIAKILVTSHNQINWGLFLLNPIPPIRILPNGDRPSPQHRDRFLKLLPIRGLFRGGFL